MKSSFKTGRQRRTNQQKLKRSKRALENRKADRKAVMPYSDNDKKSFLARVGGLQRTSGERGGVTRYRTQSRWKSFKQWAGEKLSQFRGFFKTKRQKEQERLWDMHMGQGLGTNRFLKEDQPTGRTFREFVEANGGVPKESKGKYYREAIDPPPVPHIDGIYG